MLKVLQIVNRIFTSNTYVVLDDEYDYCWLVDIGDFDLVEKYILEKKVKGVLLTHSHFDHIYGMNALHKSYTECFIITSEYGKEAIYDDKKNFSRYHETSFVYEGSDVRVNHDEEEITIFPGLTAKIYATPGHCPSCLTYVIGKWVFTGDAYIPGVKVVTKLPKGNRFQASESKKKIIKLCDGKIVCPGHGAMG